MEIVAVSQVDAHGHILPALDLGSYEVEADLEIIEVIIPGPSGAGSRPLEIVAVGVGSQTTAALLALVAEEKARAIAAESGLGTALSSEIERAEEAEADARHQALVYAIIFG